LVEPEDADAVAERVRTGSSEIGLAELPLADPDLENHPLEAQEFVALVPVALAADLDRTRLSIRTLAGQPLITSPKGTSTRRQIDEALGEAGLVANVAVETDHREAIGPLVRSGAGVAILPRSLAEEAATAEALIREITPKIVRQVGIIHRRGPLSPAAHSFLSLAVAGTPPRRGPTSRRR